MASVEKRIRDGRARWYTRYRTPDGQQRTRTFDRKLDAERFLVEVEGSKQRGAFVDPRRSGLTVGGWADEWLAGQADLSPTTRNRYEGILATHLRPRWGKVRLADVTHAEVQRWLTGLELAPASVRKVHRAVHATLYAHQLVPSEVLIGPVGSGPMPVRITFATRADLETWCTAQRAKVEHRSLAHSATPHQEYSALYDRDGRRVLAICRVWPWQEAS